MEFEDWTWRMRKVCVAVQRLTYSWADGSTTACARAADGDLSSSLWVKLASVPIGDLRFLLRSYTGASFDVSSFSSSGVSSRSRKPC